MRTSADRNFTATLPLILILPVAAALAVGACHGAPQRAPAMGPPEVTVVTLHPQPVQLTRTLPGRTSAFRVAEVRPQVSGVVKSRDFTEGSLVRAGQPLYQLDDAVYRADFDSARAALQRAEATRDAARLAAERTTKLRAVDAVSEQEKEDADAALHKAEADVAAARAAVERRQLDIGFARIPSPITGRIGRSTVTAGALVTTNQSDPLVTVQQLDPMYVDVNQSSLEWLQLQQRARRRQSRPRPQGGAGRDRARRRQPLSPPGAPAVRRRHRRPEHRQLLAARPGAQLRRTSCGPACTCRR